MKSVKLVIICFLSCVPGLAAHAQCLGCWPPFPPPPPPQCGVNFNLNAAAYQISASPAMPTIQATVVSKSPSNANVSWRATISYTAQNGTTYTSPQKTGSGNSFTPNWGTDMFGGTLRVYATCSRSGYSDYTLQRAIAVGRATAITLCNAQAKSRVLTHRNLPSDRD